MRSNVFCAKVKVWAWLRLAWETSLVILDRSYSLGRKKGVVIKKKKKPSGKSQWPLTTVPPSLSHGKLAVQVPLSPSSPNIATGSDPSLCLPNPTPVTSTGHNVSYRFVELSQIYKMAKSLSQHKCWLLFQKARVLCSPLLCMSHLAITMLWAQHSAHAANTMMFALSERTGILQLSNGIFSLNAKPAIPNSTTRWQLGWQEPFKSSLISKILRLMKIHPKLKQDTYTYLSFFFFNWLYWHRFKSMIMPTVA